MDQEFNKMKKILGKENYDILNILSGTLLSDAIFFMKKVGILEEFLEDKNEISRFFVSRILKIEKK